VIPARSRIIPAPRLEGSRREVAVDAIGGID
jgi:hypothetical protein